MTVVLRLALRRSLTPSSARLGNMTATAFAVVPCRPWPSGRPSSTRATSLSSRVAGLLAPGTSQLLFTLAVRDAGQGRGRRCLRGRCPALLAVAIALVVPDELLSPPLLLGAADQVGGGLALLGERVRPST